jgi:hypothetical protein
MSKKINICTEVELQAEKNCACVCYCLLFNIALSTNEKLSKADNLFVVYLVRHLLS